MWEKRYGFPKPDRDQFGDRAYQASEVEQLRLLRRLLDAGHRPSKVVGLPLDQLTLLAKVDAPSPESPESSHGHEVLLLLKQTDLQGLRDHIAQQLATLGLIKFVCDYLAPISHAVGEAWARSEIGVAQEHLFTEIVTRLLRGHLLQFSQLRRDGKKILFATLPGEQHGLGLLMAECIVSVNGHAAIPLGTEVPIKELLWACEAYRCDVVALSFSQTRSPAFVSDGVKAVRALLPASVELWIGGSGAAFMKGTPDGVTIFKQLMDFQDELRI